MRIGFDGKRAFQNNTGLGNYSRYLVEVLAKHFPENEYLIYAPKKKDNPRLSKILSLSNVKCLFPTSFWQKKMPSLWRTRGIVKDLKKDNVAIFHGLSNEIPTGLQNTGIKSVVSLHDLIFLRYPKLYKPIDRKIYARKFRYACEKSDVVIAISECTKRDIIHYFGIDEQKIKVVYQGCDPKFSKKLSKEQKELVSKNYQLPDKFILFVGSIEPRKNLLLIVKAMKQVEQNVHLVAVGKPTPYMKVLQKYITDNGLKERVHFHHNLLFANLPAFFQLAQFFVYPSYFEGFGIPIIEALSSGIPVVAATGSCLEEAGGEGGIYVDPDNEQQAAEAINSILNNDVLREHLIEKGKEHIQKFGDKKIAEEVMAIYKNLLSE